MGITSSPCEIYALLVLETRENIQGQPNQSQAKVSFPVFYSAFQQNPSFFPCFWPFLFLSRLVPTFTYPSLTLVPQLLLQTQYFVLISSVGPFLLQATRFSSPDSFPGPYLFFLPYQFLGSSLSYMCTFTGPPTTKPPIWHRSLPHYHLYLFIFYFLSHQTSFPTLPPTSIPKLSWAISGLLLPSISGSYCLHLPTLGVWQASA